MRIHLPLLAILTVGISVAACVPKPSDFENESSSSSSVVVLDEKQTAEAVLNALMTKDMEALAVHAHPKKGIRFTAETHVRPKEDQFGSPPDEIVYQDQLVERYADDEIETWGIQDGSGAPIELTFSQYVSKYVADHDYRQAKEIRWDHVQDHGSTIDNAAQVYPNARIVEYHFPGFEEQYGGMDWASLRLVLEQDVTTKEWKLVGVIHDHWTP